MKKKTLKEHQSEGPSKASRKTGWEPCWGNRRYLRTAGTCARCTSLWFSSNRLRRGDGTAQNGILARRGLAGGPDDPHP